MSQHKLTRFLLTSRKTDSQFVTVLLYEGKHLVIFHSYEIQPLDSRKSPLSGIIVVL